MPSISCEQWTVTRAEALDEIEQAHVAVGGTARGRRYATQQVNRAYAMLLASQFQGFCRDLHSESVAHIVSALKPPASLRPLVQAEFTRNRQLDRSNATPSTLGADFGRLGIDLWPKCEAHDARNRERKKQLEQLNAWRNAIAHQDFDSTKLGGTITLRLDQVRKWRIACEHLAKSFDEVARDYIHATIGMAPW